MGRTGEAGWVGLGQCLGTRKPTGRVKRQEVHSCRSGYGGSASVPGTGKKGASGSFPGPVRCAAGYPFRTDGRLKGRLAGHDDADQHNQAEPANDERPVLHFNEKQRMVGLDGDLAAALLVDVGLGLFRGIELIADKPDGNCRQDSADGCADGPIGAQHGKKRT